MMFLDKNHAFWMLCLLVEKKLLPDFYIGNKHGNSLNGFYVETTVIAGILEFVMPSIKNTPLPPTDFCDLFCLQFMIQLFVNTVDMKTTIFLWDKLLEEGSIALIRGTVGLVQICEKRGASWEASNGNFKDSNSE